MSYCSKITDFIENTDTFDKIKRFLKSGKSFALNCISIPGKVLLTSIFSQYTNIVLIVDSEQSAIKYKNDLKVLSGAEAVVFPYQESGLYDANIPNIYKYAEQVSVLKNFSRDKSGQIIILPLKAAFEKFPSIEFFDKNKISLKINDELDTSKLSEILIKMGYKKS